MNLPRTSFGVGCGLLLILFAQLLSGCVGYRSALNLRTVTTETTPANESLELTTWWRSDNYISSDISIMFMRFIELDGYGNLEIGFIRDQTNGLAINIDCIHLHDRENKPVLLADYASPQICPFVLVEFAACNQNDQTRTEGPKHYARTQRQVRLTKSTEPYTLFVSGHVELPNNKRSPFRASSQLSLTRKRSLEPIINFWP